MKTSSKQSKSSKSRKTKAVLESELLAILQKLKEKETECDASLQALQKARDQIDQLKKQLTSNKLEEIKTATPPFDESENQTLQRDNKELILALEKLDVQMAKLNTLQSEFQAEQEKAIKLDTENKRLKAQLEAVTGQEYNLKKNSHHPSFSKASFLIFLYQDEAMKGRIEHVLTRDKKMFTGLDEEVVFDFIKRHLPKKTDESSGKPVASSANHPRKADEPVFTPSPAQGPLHSVTQPDLTSISPDIQEKNFNYPEEGARRLKEVSLHQFGKAAKIQNLKAYQPFSIATLFYLEDMPAWKNPVPGHPSYHLQITARDKKNGKVWARKSICADLSNEMHRYKNRISMPRLKPGTYQLQISAYTPYNKKSDRLNFDICVEG